MAAPPELQEAAVRRHRRRDLNLDGEWIELAADWAFMVPIVELAASPRHIPEPLYLCQPAAAKDEDGRLERGAVVARIFERQPCR